MREEILSRFRSRRKITPPDNLTAEAAEKGAQKSRNKTCTLFAQRVQSDIVRLPMAGLRGAPLAVLTAFSRKSGVETESVTSPQSGSGRKGQTKSKAATSIAGTILRSACSRPIVRLPDGGVEGCAPSRVFSHRFFRKKRCRRRLMLFQTSPQSGSGLRAVQIESRKKRGCAAPMHSYGC